MTHNRTNLADTIRNMTPDEREVFDLMLDGLNPSNPEEIEKFVARVDAPVADLLLSLMKKNLVQKQIFEGRSFLQINPAALWLLAEQKDRIGVRRENKHYN